MARSLVGHCISDLDVRQARLEQVLGMRLSARVKFEIFLEGTQIDDARLQLGLGVRLMHELIQPDRLEVPLDNPMDFRQRDRLLTLGELDGTHFATT